MANPWDVDTHTRLMRRIDREQDDLLGTLQLVRGDAELTDHLFDQLVDLLVESMFLELRRRHLDGSIAREDYVAELAELAQQCRDAGLLPLPAPEG